MLNYIHFPVEKIVCQKGKKPVTNTGELPALKHFYVYIHCTVSMFQHLLKLQLLLGNPVLKVPPHLGQKDLSLQIA